MDRGLESVVRHAIANARAIGWDYHAQTEEAVRTVRLIRPDMTTSFFTVLFGIYWTPIDHLSRLAVNFLK